MRRKVVVGIFAVLGLILALPSLSVLIIPRVDVNYDAVSTVFILGLICLMIAFFLKRSSSGEKSGVIPGKVAKVGKKSKKRKR